MATLPRTLARACGVILGVHCAMTSSLLLCSRVANDEPFEEHWAYSQPTLRRRPSSVAFWNASFYSPVLTSEERECLDVWLRTLSLQSPPFATIQISPRVTLQDSLSLLQGLNEVRDGVYMLEHLPLTVEPYLVDLRREYQDEVVFLHGKTSTDIAVRVPFTAYKLPLCAFPASFTLQLERTHPKGPHLTITTVEHRWFGGCIFSQLTNSVRSPWGDIGDLCRRYNGFLGSLMVTKTISLEERRRALVEKVAEKEAALRKQQAEQVKL